MSSTSTDRESESQKPSSSETLSLSLDATVELMQYRLARKAGTMTKSANPLAATAAFGVGYDSKSGDSSSDSLRASGMRKAGVSAEDALVMSWSNLRWSHESLVSNA